MKHGRGGGKTTKGMGAGPKNYRGNLKAVGKMLRGRIANHCGARLGPKGRLLEMT
jgi:hypothetical protein